MRHGRSRSGTGSRRCSTADLHRGGHEPRHTQEGAAGKVRDPRVPRSARGGEVPDRVRSTAAPHDVRGQAARRPPGRADAVAPEPDSPAQRRHLRSRLRQRSRRDPQHVEDDGFEWVAVETRHRLRPGMFVAQVVGKSMEPVVPDGAYCLFAAPVAGTRQGKTVLVQLRDAADPESGER